MNRVRKRKKRKKGPAYVIIQNLADSHIYNTAAGGSRTYHYPYQLKIIKDRDDFHIISQSTPALIIIIIVTTCKGLIKILVRQEQRDGKGNKMRGDEK